MAIRLKGTHVLITGASEGIGRAAAKAFVERGADVVAVARSRERLASLAGELQGTGRVTAVPADVTDASSMEAMAARVLEDCGLPGVLVVNAGIGLDALFTETTDEMWRSVFEVNVFGAARTVRLFLPRMIERGSGRVLLVSSVVGKRGIPHYAAYSASKFALHGMADALRSELWRSGVSVGIVCPSSTESEFHARKLSEGPAQKEVRLAQHTAESVARAIVKMAASRRREVVLSAEGKLLAFANKIVPGMLDGVLGRWLTRRHA